MCHFIGAITNIQSQHHYTSNDIDTATVAIKAGTNLELGSRVFDNIVSTCELVVMSAQIHVLVLVSTGCYSHRFVIYEKKNSQTSVILSYVHVRILAVWIDV